ncbi:beta-ketoacyl synthase N-terminal-like domain-containing protein [Gilvimarinus sp. F26214L]|uniref:beta-ketoacyl synthase N-terminal-like domain-containing protein n=1 Tax=Gilvimarinus sp. DZF01 TaxID=3461371 RepID=UPI004045E02E
MNSAFFLGSALHTSLGSTLCDSVAALHRGLPQAASVPCTLKSGTAPAIPYFLLSGLPIDDPVLRLDHVLIKVMEDAIAAAGLNSAQRRQMALFVGSSSFDIAAEEARYRAALDAGGPAIALADCGMGNLTERIRQKLDLGGEDYTFNTACTSSANALWYASKLIELGEIEHALVVGVEFVNTTTTYGFQALQLLSPGAMRPFDRERDGLVLGESCAALVIGRSPERKGFHLRGGANNCDTYSVSTTREDGSAVQRVIEQALHNARLRPEAIRAIKCHGTATLSGDAAEANGMLGTFQTLPPCTTLKPYIGHTLGACGLAELILFCRAIEDGFLPGTPGVAAEDSGLGFTLNQASTPIGAGHFMLNYFGFGGNSTSLIVSNGPAQ